LKWDIKLLREAVGGQDPVGLRDAHGGHDQASLKMLWKAVIE